MRTWLMALGISVSVGLALAIAFVAGEANMARYQMRALGDIEYCTSQLATRLIPTATAALMLIQGRDTLLVRVLGELEAPVFKPMMEVTE